MTGTTSPHRKPGSTAAPLRVLIVDDSLTMRSVLTRIVEPERNLAIVGKFGSAELALDVLDQLAPDIVLLDLELPGISGLEALPRILAACPAAQVLVISSLTAKGAETTVQALAMGAVDTMPKPVHLVPAESVRGNGGLSPAMQFERELRAKLRGLSGRVPGRTAARPAETTARMTPPARRPIRRANGAAQLVAIGASTGGIHALIQLLRALPPTVTAPILVTQHLPAAFVPVFARQLETAARRPAIVAGRGTALRPSRIYVAPGDGHLTVHAGAEGLTTGIAIGAVPSGCTPSVDPMLSSIAKAVDGCAVGVILSGMGRDGANGARDLFEAGGVILAQDRESSAVWGMPRAVVEAGMTDCCAPPDKLALRIAALVGTSADPVRDKTAPVQFAGAAS